MLMDSTYNLRFLMPSNWWTIGQIVHGIRMLLYIRSIRWREPFTFPTGNETAGGGLIDTTMCYMFLFNRERTFHNGPSWIERLSHLLSIVVLEEATSLLLLPFTTTLPHSKDWNFPLTLLYVAVYLLSFGTWKGNKNTNPVFALTNN